MGNIFGKCFGRKQNNRRIVLLLVGLDNAGKTRTANHLTGEGDRDVLPTVGFKAVNLVHRSNPVTIYDLGGGPQFREIWDQYYTDVHGVIFVVDSTDFQRVDECRDVFEHVLSHEKISGLLCSFGVCSPYLCFIWLSSSDIKTLADGAI